MKIRMENMILAACVMLWVMFVEASPAQRQSGDTHSRKKKEKIHLSFPVDDEENDNFSGDLDVGAVGTYENDCANLEMFGIVCPQPITSVQPPEISEQPGMESELNNPTKTLIDQTTADLRLTTKYSDFSDDERIKSTQISVSTSDSALIPNVMTSTIEPDAGIDFVEITEVGEPTHVMGVTTQVELRTASKTMNKPDTVKMPSKQTEVKDQNAAVSARTILKTTERQRMDTTRFAAGSPLSGKRMESGLEAEATTNSDRTKKPTDANEKGHLRPPKVATPVGKAHAADITTVAGSDIAPQEGNIRIIILAVCVASLLIFSALFVAAVVLFRSRIKRRGKYGITLRAVSEERAATAEGVALVNGEKIVTVKYNDAKA